MDWVSVALIDDQPIVIEGFERFCSATPGLRLVGTATGTARVGNIFERRPDIILFDIANSANSLEHLTPFLANIKLVAFTASENIKLAVGALDFGAHGYILKNTALDELSRALRAIAQGERYVSHCMANKLIAAVHAETARNVVKRQVQFSARETQVLRLLLEGKTNKAIAEILTITENTVKHYMSVLMQKLHARNRVEVLIAAQKLEQIAQSIASSGQIH